MTTFNNYLKRFEAFQNGDLDAEESISFKQDLEKDSEMRKAWKEYSAIMKAISDREAISLRDLLEKTYLKNFKEKRWIHSKAIWFRASAAALVIFATVTLLYFFCDREQSLFISNQLSVVKSDGKESDLKEEVLSEKITPNEERTLLMTEDSSMKQFDEATNNENEVTASIYDKEEYQINPVYKELLNTIYRGGWFKLLNPGDSILIDSGDKIYFKWETNISDSIYFDILDRNGQVVYTHMPAVSSPWIIEKSLDPAIYMYRFSTKEEPLWLGVMVIKQ
jgi:hypothetical protein